MKVIHLILAKSKKPTVPTTDARPVCQSMNLFVCETVLLYLDFNLALYSAASIRSNCHSTTNNTKRNSSQRDIITLQRLPQRNTVAILKDRIPWGIRTTQHPSSEYRAGNFALQNLYTRGICSNVDYSPATTTTCVWNCTPARSEHVRDK